MSEMASRRPLVPAFAGIYSAFEPLVLPLVRFGMGSGRPLPARTHWLAMTIE